MSVAAMCVSNPDCRLVLRQINCGHEKTTLSPLWPARCDACLLHLLRVPDQHFRSFRVDNVHACTQQKRWSFNHSQGTKVWDSRKAECFHRWLASSFAWRGSILQWHLVAGQAHHIRECDAGPWSWRDCDKARYGTSGADLHLHCFMEQ